MEELDRIGSALASGVENAIAFVTSKRVLSMLAAYGAMQAGLPPELAAGSGGALIAGFTITDALGKGKGAK